MARETLAQRNARLEAEHVARLTKEVAEYPQRLMVTLARATNAYFELAVSDNKFLVTTDVHRDRDRDAVRPPRGGLGQRVALGVGHGQPERAQAAAVSSRRVDLPTPGSPASSRSRAA